MSATSTASSTRSKHERGTPGGSSRTHADAELGDLTYRSMVASRKSGVEFVSVPGQSASLLAAERGHLGGEVSVRDVTPAQQSVEYRAALWLQRAVAN